MKVSVRSTAFSSSLLLGLFFFFLNFHLCCLSCVFAKRIFNKSPVSRSLQETPSTCWCVSPFLAPQNTLCWSLACSHGPLWFNSPEKEVKQRPWKHREWVGLLPLKQALDGHRSTILYIHDHERKHDVNISTLRPPKIQPGWISPGYLLKWIVCFKASSVFFRTVRSPLQVSQCSMSSSPSRNRTFYFSLSCVHSLFPSHLSLLWLNTGRIKCVTIWLFFDKQCSI